MRLGFTIRRIAKWSTTTACLALAGAWLLSMWQFTVWTSGDLVHKWWLTEGAAGYGWYPPQTEPHKRWMLPAEAGWYTRDYWTIPKSLEWPKRHVSNGWQCTEIPIWMPLAIVAVPLAWMWGRHLTFFALGACCRCGRRAEGQTRCGACGARVRSRLRGLARVGMIACAVTIAVWGLSVPLAASIEVHDGAGGCSTALECGAFDVHWSDSISKSSGRGIDRLTVGGRTATQKRWLAILGFVLPVASSAQTTMAVKSGLPRTYIDHHALIPLWTILVIMALPTALLVRLARGRLPPWHCRKCGYDLTGNESGVCPECGRKITIPLEKLREYQSGAHADAAAAVQVERE